MAWTSFVNQLPSFLESIFNPFHLPSIHWTGSSELGRDGWTCHFINGIAYVILRNPLQISEVFIWGEEGRVVWEPDGNLEISNSDNQILQKHLQVSREQLTEKKNVFLEFVWEVKGFFWGEEGREWVEEIISFWHCNISGIFESKYNEMRLFISLASKNEKQVH